MTTCTIEDVMAPFDRALPLRQPQPQPYDTDVARALDKAADYIEQHGWIQFTLFNEKAACALGAIYMASGSGRNYLNVVGLETVKAMVKHISPRLKPIQVYMASGVLCAWNNNPWRTKEEVVATFRDAATAERFKEAKIEEIEEIEVGAQAGALMEC